MIISKTGHSVNSEDITRLTVWDKSAVIGRVSYVGCVDYNLEGKWFINPITSGELAQIKEVLHA